MNALRLYRLARWLYKYRVPLLPRLIQKLNFTLTRCVVPYRCEIGPGTELAYGGIAVVIHERAVLGKNIMIGPCVTIGGRAGHYAVPVIEDHVEVGAGASILGPIRIGEGAKIGAGAVVIHSVAPKTIAVGVPARPLS